MSTLMARLKAETGSHHRRLEQDLDLLSETLGPARVRTLLGRFYGFYRPWEERAAPVLEAGLPSPMAGRLKSHLLERDLARLGLDGTARAALPRCADLPALDRVPTALGSMYVLEGATLGGQVVCRHLARVLGAGAATAFFGSYGSDVPGMWLRFGAALEACAEPATDDAVIEGANETFRRLHGWLADDPPRAA